MNEGKIKHITPLEDSMIMENLREEMRMRTRRRGFHHLVGLKMIFIHDYPLSCLRYNTKLQILVEKARVEDCHTQLASSTKVAAMEDINLMMGQRDPDLLLSRVGDPRVNLFQKFMDCIYISFISKARSYTKNKAIQLGSRDICKCS